MIYYKVHGMNITSEIDLLLPSETQHMLDDQIMVRCVIQVTQPGDGAVRYGDIIIARDECTYAVPDVGEFYIGQGNLIEVVPYTEDLHTISMYVLGSALGFALIQRGIYPLHGSAVTFDGKTVCLVADSGGGKSTLAAAFLKKGGQLISDDVSRIEVDDGRVLIWPSVKKQRFTDQTLEYYGIDKDEALDFTVDGKAVIHHSNGVEDVSRLDAVIEIVPSDKECVTLEELDGTDKLRCFMKHSYRKWMIDASGREGDHFSKIGPLMALMPVYRMRRPKGVISVDEQIRVIMAEVFK